MNDKQITHFKNMLRSMRFYEENIEALQDEIEIIQYQMNGVKGVNLEGVRGTGERTFNYALLEKKDYLKREKEAYEILLKKIQNVFKQLNEETKDALIDIYVENLTYDVVAEKYNYSKHGIFNKIHSELRKVIMY